MEFFLICSGAFLFRSFEKAENMPKQLNPVQYAKKRFLRMFPWALTAFVFTFVVKRLYLDRCFSLGQLANCLSGDIWEILLVKINGMNLNTPLLNGPAWTISAMLIVGFILWGFLYYDKKRIFRDWLMPASLLFSYGIWRHLESGDHQVWIGWTTFAVFRTYIGMCLGYYAYRLAGKLSKIQLSPLGSRMLSLAEITLHIAAALIILKRDTRNFQWLASLIFMLSIAIAMAKKSSLSRLLDKIKAIDFLGDFSMSVYLTHYGVKLLVEKHFMQSHWNANVVIVYFGAVMIVSLIHHFFTRWFVKTLCPKVASLCKKYCLRAELTDPAGKR